MPAEEKEERKPGSTIPPVSTGSAPHVPGGGAQPDGNHEPFDDPATKK
ncbi:hypothetical protein [Amycolatopsis jejuensis]|nr:hypothetical protein [Amycolatopsis jejuensis]